MTIDEVAQEPVKSNNVRGEATTLGIGLVLAGYGTIVFGPLLHAVTNCDMDIAYYTGGNYLCFDQCFI